MSYQSWHTQHAKKHQKIVDKLNGLSTDQIIDYFKFENMVQHEPDFCTLYKESRKCHDIEDLNCYFCACPNFRVGEMKSSCSIESADGGTIVGKNGYIHQDCSKCSVPHSSSYIKKYFNLDWSDVMKDTFKS